MSGRFGRKGQVKGRKKSFGKRVTGGKKQL